MLQAPPLSLYVHIPWCVRKCPYCDFNSHAAPQSLPQRQYVDALLEDLEQELTEVGEREIVSIFFGGGTPSLFEPEQIGRLLEGVRARIAVCADAEVTLEANPGTIEHGRFAGYRAAGINRVSLGAQTFSPRHLQILGRIHGSDDIARAVDELRRAGIENFNLDLMYALPEQTVQEALDDLERAIALTPAHLSHYQLTLEPGTVFYHRPPPLPDDDTAWEMQQQCQARLAAAGYAQYEVSAYALPGRRCAHNLNYWRFGDYLGIGAGAHGKTTLVARNSIVRKSRVRQPREYLNRAPAARYDDVHPVSAADLPFEFMLNALRLVDGCSLDDFERYTGLHRSCLDERVRDAVSRGLLLQPDANRVVPSELGRRFLNELHALFLPE
jgi:putative oxygen-independent coproporphyrinogen III oxidase